jgi:hypothetical protein
MVSSSFIRHFLNQIAIPPIKRVMHLAKSRLRQAPRNGTLRLTIVFAIPPLMLLIDYYFYPLIYSTKVQIEGLEVNINTLFVERTMRLGIYQAHDIYASIDDVRATDYLGFLVHRIRRMVRRPSARYRSPACPHRDGLNHVTESEH